MNSLTNEISEKILILQVQLITNKLDGVFIIENADLYYFTGTTQSGTLFIPAEGEPVYCVRKDYERALRESSIKNIIQIKSMQDFASAISSFNIDSGIIGMELDVVPCNILHRYQRTYPNVKFIDASDLIRCCRMIKTPHEIDQMRIAAKQMDAIFQHAYTYIHEGLSDIELSAELEKTARLNGHQGFVRLHSFNHELYMNQVLSGTDAAISAYVDAPFGGPGLSPAFGQGAGYKKIAHNEAISIDFAATWNGYIVDQTRVAVIGKLSSKLEKAYIDMVEILDLMTTLVKPGAIWGDVYNQCLELACSMGYKDNFMGRAGSQVSFIGHGIGLEIDEYPFIARGFNSQKFETGMTFAFEPKVVFPGEGAVGIEDTLAITDTGVEYLTYTPREIKVL